MKPAFYQLSRSLWTKWCIWSLDTEMHHIHNILTDLSSLWCYLYLTEILGSGIRHETWSKSISQSDAFKLPSQTQGICLFPNSLLFVMTFFYGTLTIGNGSHDFIHYFLLLFQIWSCMLFTYTDSLYEEFRQRGNLDSSEHSIGY